MVIFAGWLFGTLFFLLGEYVPRAKFRSFALTSLVRSLVLVAGLTVGMLLIMPVAVSLSMHKPIWDSQVRGALQYVTVYMVPIWVGIGLVMALVVTSVFRINEKLGPGVLFKWITGKYHNPKEEERIFMFLDLKNSTTLAEKLGNLRFSSLCQDFFRDLSRPVQSTNGEVSHYIGDEAVLSWIPKNGLDQANCLRCFYYMQWAIDQRREHYLREYGVVPEFKAGVHMGLVVASEVGEVKSEIVYHGDVLNTTARITGLCSELQSDLLVSGDLAQRITLPPGTKARSLGPRLLKGKEHEVEIVAIDKEGGSSPVAIYNAERAEVRA